MLIEVPIASLHASNVWLLDIFQRYATMHLQCLESYNEHGEVWLQTSLAALDVVELLCTEVGTEASLCDGIVAILQSGSCSHY